MRDRLLARLGLGGPRASGAPDAELARFALDVDLAAQDVLPLPSMRDCPVKRHMDAEGIDDV